MHLSVLFLHSFPLWILLCSRTTAIPPDSLTLNLSAQTLASLERLKPITDSSNQDLNSSTIKPLQDLTGCFPPHSEARVISPQEALIALGRLASPKDFFINKPYTHTTLISTWRSVTIGVFKIRPGDYDDFSLFDIASQAIEIIKFCVIQQPADARLGGALDVGSRNVFRVVVQFFG
ncbi:MAG: hypothetical protein Q9207_001884, partial [Kuettlingeria erythrocarpa]